MDVKYTWLLTYEDGTELGEVENNKRSNTGLSSKIDLRDPPKQAVNIKAIPNVQGFHTVSINIPKIAKPVYHRFNHINTSTGRKGLLYAIGWNILGTRIMTTIDHYTGEISMKIDQKGLR